MDLAEMRAMLRRDLHDEESSNYRWTDDELDRHISHAVRDLSLALPLEETALLATTAGSREIDISSLTDRVSVELVEYPPGRFPVSFQRFSLRADVITLLGEALPDGSDARICYGKPHTLDAGGSTIPPILEDTVAGGAAGYAAVEWALYAVNRVNTGSDSTPGEFLAWGESKLKWFNTELKKLGRKNRVRIRSLFQADNPTVSKSTDYGP